jgi:hypothetical protein
MCRPVARRQQVIAVGLVLRNCLLKTRQGGRPQFDAFEIGVDPTKRLDQIADDQIFRSLCDRNGGLFACHVLPFESNKS